jgi:hypothetical protein
LLGVRDRRWRFLLEERSEYTAHNTENGEVGPGPTSIARSLGFAGSRTIVAPRCVSVFTVASTPKRAAIMSPSFAFADGDTITKSPSSTPRPFMLSPLIFTKKTSSVGTKRRSIVMKYLR